MSLPQKNEKTYTIHKSSNFTTNFRSRIAAQSRANIANTLAVLKKFSLQAIKSATQPIGQTQFTPIL